MMCGRVMDRLYHMNFVASVCYFDSSMVFMTTMIGSLSRNNVKRLQGRVCTSKKLPRLP